LIAEVLQEGRERHPALAIPFGRPAPDVGDPAAHPKRFPHLLALVAAVPHGHVALIFVHLAARRPLLLVFAAGGRGKGGGRGRGGMHGEQ